MFHDQISMTLLDSDGIYPQEQLSWKTEDFVKSQSDYM